MAEQTTRNVFFVRWTDDESAIQGMHIEERWAYIDANGVEQASKMLPPRPVAPTDADALAAISSSINAATLADNAAKDAQIATLTGERDGAVADKDAALAQVDALNARIAELQPPAINGVPQEVTMRQAQLALLATKLADGSSLLDRVDAAIAGMTGDAGRAAQITWAKSAYVMRANPLIVQLQGALGLSDAQVDALFTAAAKL